MSLLQLFASTTFDPFVISEFLESCSSDDILIIILLSRLSLGSFLLSVCVDSRIDCVGVVDCVVVVAEAVAIVCCV